MTMRVSGKTARPGSGPEEFLAVLRQCNPGQPIYQTRCRCGAWSIGLAPLSHCEECGRLLETDILQAGK